MRASPSSSPAPSRWRDAVAGVVVALLALPLGIATSIASGFPPFAGIVTSIVAGLVATPLGSAPLTIKGPAAGLIVVVLAAVESLGAGDPSLGVRRTAALVAIAGVVQLALGAARAGKYAELVPAFAVRGMLAAIGVLLLAKQAHVLLGVTPLGKTPLALLLEIPASVLHADPVSALIGLGTLATMVLWRRLAPARAAAVPAAIPGLAVALALGACFDLDHARTVNLLGTLRAHVGPEDLVPLAPKLAGLVQAPEFTGLLGPAGLEHLLLLVLVGTLETLVSAKAVDALDPLNRRSDLDRDLRAVGAGNVVAGLVGGLPMISEIVRSSANVAAGGRTRRANAIHGLVLALCLGLAPALVHRLPLAALAAMLVVSAVNLATPKTFALARSLGRDQALVYAATIVATLATDLLVGVLAGVAVEGALHLARGVRPRELTRLTLTVEQGAETLHVRVMSPATFSNSLTLRELVCGAPEACRVVVDVSSARFVDHSVLAVLDACDRTRRARGAASFTLLGLEAYANAEAHPLSTRHTPRAPRALAETR
jgi:MFS superfamily sulfate permease-like transporter